MVCFCFGARQVHAKTAAVSLDLKKYGLTDETLGSRKGLATAYHLFSGADKDGSGRLDKFEFALAFGFPDNPYAYRLHEMIDDDGSGGIDFVEFLIGLTMFEGPSACRSERFVFQALDASGDGQISEAEIRDMLKQEMQMLPASRRKEKKSKAWDDHKSADQVASKDLEQRYRKLLDEMHSKGFLKLQEWEPICSRFPQVFFPGQQVFSCMRLYSKSAADVVAELRAAGVPAFLEKEQKVAKDPAKRGLRNKASRLGERMNNSFSRLGKAASGSFSKVKRVAGGAGRSPGGSNKARGRAPHASKPGPGGGGRGAEARAEPPISSDDVANLAELGDFEDGDGEITNLDDSAKDMAPLPNPGGSGKRAERYVYRPEEGSQANREGGFSGGGGGDRGRGKGRSFGAVARAAQATGRFSSRTSGRDRDRPPPLEKAGGAAADTGSPTRRGSGARRESSGASPNWDGGSPTKRGGGGSGVRRESSGSSPSPIHPRIRAGGGSGEHEREKKNSLRRIMLKQASEVKRGGAPAAREPSGFRGGGNGGSPPYKRLSSGSGSDWAAAAGGGGSHESSPDHDHDLMLRSTSRNHLRSGNLGSSGRRSDGSPTPPRRLSSGASPLNGGPGLRRMGSDGGRRSHDGSPTPPRRLSSGASPLNGGAGLQRIDSDGGRRSHEASPLPGGPGGGRGGGGRRSNPSSPTHRGSRGQESSPFHVQRSSQSMTAGGGATGARGGRSSHDASPLHASGPAAGGGRRSNDASPARLTPPRRR